MSAMRKVPINAEHLLQMVPKDCRTVVSIAKVLGIRLILSNLDSDKFGFALRDPESGFSEDSIYVAKSLDDRSRNYLVARMIGCFLMFDGNSQIGKVDTVASWARPNEIDTELHQFAIDLLMPKSEFLQLFQKAESFENIAQHFGVTVNLAFRRGVDLGLSV